MSRHTPEIMMKNCSSEKIRVSLGSLEEKRDESRGGGKEERREHLKPNHSPFHSNLSLSLSPFSDQCVPSAITMAVKYVAPPV